MQAVATSTATGTKPISVMLVDDHQTMLWGLSKLIDGQSPRMKVVGTATSCEEAVDQVGRLVPDVIVLDLDLSGRSALEILPSLLSNSVSRALILTGERQQKTLDQAVLGGARGVLCKDASAEKVLEAIEKLYLGELWLDGDTVGRVFAEFMQAKKPARMDGEAEKQSALTAKERKIICTIVEANGASNKALAARLFITEHTLRNHLTSIYQKLGVANRLELYVYAVKHQLGKAPN
jgi:DNA-binding NarL/FixJ family response regulator